MPDVVVEVKGGCVTGVYTDLPLGVVLIDWDNLTEPDGVSSFLAVDGDGRPQIATAAPLPAEPLETLSAEAKQVVGFLAAAEGQPRAQ